MSTPTPSDERNWTEAKLQSECFQWHWKTFPQYRGLLFTVDNNANDRVKGSIRLAMGRIAGVSDMIYLFMGKCYCIELKRPGQKQSPDQKKWEQTVGSQCIEYVVVCWLDDFKKVIDEIHKYQYILPF